jgi:hypothetical protein
MLNDSGFVSSLISKGESGDKAYTSQNVMTAFLTEAREQPSLEIFDVKTEKVVKQLGMEAGYKKAAENFLASIDGVYVKVNAFPQNGFIVRVPLIPAEAIYNKWFNGEVNQVFILFPQNEKPYLLVLDDKSRPQFFNFTGDTAAFLKSLGYQPEERILPSPSVSPAGCSSHAL